MIYRMNLITYIINEKQEKFITGGKNSVKNQGNYSVIVLYEAS